MITMALIIIKIKSKSNSMNSQLQRTIIKVNFFYSLQKKLS